MFEDVLILKKGGIHIKKKNRGKFTEYCGGKVTEECIAKGKKSKNPKIRKRATFAANARKWKHKSGGILKAQEGTSELYPAGIAIPSNETIDFFKDFAQRYKKLNHINRDQLIQGLVAKDKAIVSNIGLPKYNTDTKQIFIPSDDMGVSTYPHELAHKLNDLVIKRTDKERKLLNDAYPLSIAKHVYGRAPEDMKNELIEDEKFSTNTELRRKISSDYGNVLGKKLNKVIKSLSTNDVVNYVNNINGYVGESDFLKYPEHIIDGKTLFEHWKEDIGDVPEYYNMPWEELPKFEQNQWQYLYDSREGVAPDYMIFDEDKPKAIKKALIKVAQESKSNDIRSKNFINVSRQGGILKAQNSAKLPGYVQYNGSDLSDIETFNKNWLNYRNSQLANQGWKDESIKNKLNWFQRNFGASDKTVANLVREQLFSNLDNTKELSFSDALKDLQGRYLLTESMYADFPGERELHEVEIGPPKPVEDWKLDYSFNGSVGGTHYPDFNTIIYNGLYQNTPVKIHERDHAMFGQYDDKNIGLKIVDNIFKHEFLDDVVDKWGYYDEPGEIRARLMQMRYNNQLDPKHKYTFDEIENMRNDPTFIDEHIFDRYTNRYIEYLLNDVAQNTTNKNRLDYRSPINFAKVGGILKAQNGTGNLLTPHPLSPVGIALNQAKAMTKGKKDRQYLPPGVKEVVGPDGKKVAIRTEQPLQPLEQNIAEWLPGTGDVAEIGYIGNDVKNGNLGSAALAAGLMVIPGNVRKLLGKYRKAVSETTDVVEDAVRKANTAEYINNIDDTYIDPVHLERIAKSEQITRFNKFAKKYGYPEITDLNISNSRLDELTKNMLERHNTYYRGVVMTPEVEELAKTLNISNEEALKIAATIPRKGESHIFVSPASNAGIYGGGAPAKIRRPYKLGHDRTKWFNEANFQIEPPYAYGGNPQAEVIYPWHGSYSETKVPNELLLKKGEFIEWMNNPKVDDYVGSNNRVFSNYDSLTGLEFLPLEKFKQGGKL